GEDEGDVDVDPAGDRGLDGRDPGGGGRDLDEHVGPGQLVEQPPGVAGGGVGVVGDVGRDLERDAAVDPAGPLPRRLHVGGGGPDVVQGQRLEDPPGVQALAGQAADVVVVERPL